MEHIPAITCEVRYRPDGTSMVSGSLPMFLAMTERIFAKYAPLIQDRPEIHGRFLSHLFSLQYDVEMLLEGQMLEFAGLQPDLLEAAPQYATLLERGATRAQILSAWYSIRAGFEGDPPEKESCLNRALELNPANSSARCKLIGLLASQGRGGDIASHMDILLAANPLDETVQSLAISLHRAGLISAINESGKGIPRSIKVAIFSEAEPADAARYYRVRRGGVGELEILWGTYRSREDGSLSLLSTMAEQADLLLISGRFHPRESYSGLDDLLAMGKPVIYDAVDFVPAKGISDLDTPMLKLLTQASLILVSLPAMFEEYSGVNRNVVLLSDSESATVWLEIFRALLQSKASLVEGDET